MAILRQQLAFIDELFASGIVNEVERCAMQVRSSGSAHLLQIVLCMLLPKSVYGFGPQSAAHVQ